MSGHTVAVHLDTYEEEMCDHQRMRLGEAEAWERVEAARHAVLGTVHSDRGVDLVPVVFAIDEAHLLFIPVDTVKAKVSTRLQRIDNLRNDPRCTVLVEAYDDDWSRLWWVRINGHGAEASAADTERFVPLLADRYPQYRDSASVVGGVVVRTVNVAGWSARDLTGAPAVRWSQSSDTLR
ncbi:MAG: hypothetical protein BMS9Abin07_1265 [Acidimicrobiia bacterium]|nr:MAG: hypothetical protein BMS9Abin07_1265 [Acidimicrobiia bacterium]